MEKEKIKAEELRLNNWISKQYKSKPESNVEYQATASCILDISANGNLSVFEYYPIPLTEEWLIRFGFEFSDRVKPKGYWKNGMCIEKMDSMLIEFKNGIGLKYVHQLQNLYFALVGEELVLTQ